MNIKYQDREKKKENKDNLLYQRLLCKELNLLLYYKNVNLKKDLSIRSDDPKDIFLKLPGMNLLHYQFSKIGTVN